ASTLTPDRNRSPEMNGSPAPKPPAPEPARPAALSPSGGDGLAEALRVTRETMTALQRMQEQTAQLHRQFLEGQESAQRTVQLLIEQQQRLLQASLGLTPAPAPVPPLPPPRETAPIARQAAAGE